MRKILIFHNYTTSVGGGLSLLHILESIDLNKYQVKVAIPDFEGDLAKKISSLGIDIIIDSKLISTYAHYNGYTTLYLSMRHYRDVNKIIKNKKYLENFLIQETPDLVMVNSLTLYLIGNITKKLNIKSICFIRETFTKGLLGFRTNNMKRSILENFERIIFISSFDMAKAIKNREQFSAKCSVITDKVDIALYNKQLHMDSIKHELHINSEKVILFLGGVNKLKGTMTIIKALPKINYDYRLILLQYNQSENKKSLKNCLKRLIGKDYYFKLHRYIRKYNLEKKIILLPATDAVYKYFSVADAVVFPSNFAHQARPIYEAGISRVPIIITDFENTREFLDDTNGWKIKKGNHIQLADTLNYIFDSKNQYEVNGRIKNNYNRSFKTNNKDTMFYELNSIIDGLCEEENK